MTNNNSLTITVLSVIFVGRTGFFFLGGGGGGCHEGKSLYLLLFLVKVFIRVELAL